MEEPLVWEGGSRECCPPPCLFTLWQVHLRGALWLRDMRRNSSVNTSDIWHINKLGNTPAQAAQVNSDLLSPGVKSAALEMEKKCKVFVEGAVELRILVLVQSERLHSSALLVLGKSRVCQMDFSTTFFFLLFFPYFFPTI